VNEISTGLQSLRKPLMNKAISGQQCLFTPLEPGRPPSIHIHPAPRQPLPHPDSAFRERIGDAFHAAARDVHLYSLALA
ncbi:MAG TPA: hypothetical protein VFK08_00820, partial [Rhodanobacteraceae bacterium]|nr:hypothetical protein [Rhodanobacteraceae bacterium]